MSGSRMSDGSRNRIAENRHRLGVEQVAAQDLADARRARANGEEAEYVPLWRRGR